MKKAYFIILLFALALMVTSCADAYLVETVYAPDRYIIVDQRPYSRVVVSRMTPPHPHRPYGYVHKPQVRHRHYYQPQRPIVINKPNNGNFNKRR